MAEGNRGSAIMGFVVLLGFAGWGGWMVYDGSRERGLGTAREVEVAAARAAASDPTPVRLRGLLVGLPEAPRSPAGDEYALQLVTITHTEGSGDDERTETLYDQRLPEQLYLSAGDSSIAVDAAELDTRYLPTVALGEAGDGGQLPDSIARHVGHLFTGIRARDGSDVGVHGIRAADTVIAYGTIALRDGVPVLTAPSNGDPMIVSSASFAEIQRQVAENDEGSRFVGWLLLGLGLLGAFVVWWFGLRRG